VGSLPERVAPISGYVGVSVCDLAAISASVWDVGRRTLSMITRLHSHHIRAVVSGGIGLVLIVAVFVAIWLLLRYVRKTRAIAKEALRQSQEASSATGAAEAEQRRL
jgi:hypothetical protein